MNANEMHGTENVILCTTINIFFLDEALEYKILFWNLEVGERTIWLEEYVWFSLSQEHKPIFGPKLFLTLHPAGHIWAISVLMQIWQ